MCPLDAEFIQNRHRIGHAQRHRICLHLPRLVTASDPAVGDVDEAELVRRQLLQCLGDVRLSHQINRVNDPSMHDDRGSIAAVILEVHPASIQSVRRVRYERSSSRHLIPIVFHSL